VIEGGQSKYQVGEKVTPKLKQEMADEILRQQSGDSGSQADGEDGH